MLKILLCILSPITFTDFNYIISPIGLFDFFIRIPARFALKLTGKSFAKCVCVVVVVEEIGWIRAITRN